MSKQKSVDGLEERIKQLSSTLQRGNNKNNNHHRHSSPIRPRSNNLVENNNNNNAFPSASSSASLAPRSTHMNNNSNRRSVPLSSDQYNSGNCNGFTTLRNSSRETLSSIGVANTNSGNQQHRKQQQPVASPSVSHDLMTGKVTIRKEKEKKEEVYDIYNNIYIYLIHVLINN